ncbi:MAG: Lrp/AsnC family transcriptional regulator [Candidatus Hodarchaeales archaeon]|jgi:DNA-binding Lrp family transcriptional regulator
MTAGAYVLINAEVGTEDQVLGQVQDVENVKEAYIVYGVYDLIVRVEAENMALLKDIITEKIRKIELVRSTLTMILM